MIEKQSYQEPFSEVDKRKDDEMEIDLMAIFYKIITVRGNHPFSTLKMYNLHAFRIGQVKQPLHFFCLVIFQEPSSLLFACFYS